MALLDTVYVCICQARFMNVKLLKSSTLSHSFIIPLHMIVGDYLKLHPQSDMAFRVPQQQRQSSKVQYFFLQRYHICYMVHTGAPCPLYRVHLENKTSVDPQKAPISVPHPWADLADPLKPLRWAAGEPRGAKGLKETCSGTEDDGVEEEEEVEGAEEEGVGRGRGEALVAL